MKRPVFYLAAPLRPDVRDLAEVPTIRYERGTGEYEPDAQFLIPEDERQKSALRANIDRALYGLAWLRRSFPDVTFIAPWIASVLSGENDAEPAQREAGLVDACAVIERCDGVILYGGRASTGMLREMAHGQHHVVGFRVIDLSRWREPPPSLEKFELWSSTTLGPHDPDSKRCACITCSIARSSIGEGLEDIKQRGVEAHVASLPGKHRHET